MDLNSSAGSRIEQTITGLIPGQKLMCYRFPMVPMRVLQMLPDKLPLQTSYLTVLVSAGIGDMPPAYKRGTSLAVVRSDADWFSWIGK